jgi:RNA polymerase sigma-70 factor (ECF subfamily)
MAKALVERLFLEHHTQLTRALTRAFGCETLACDAAQDAYLRMLRYRAAPIDNPKAYLFRSAFNALSDQAARERRRPDSSHSMDEFAERMPSAEPQPEKTVCDRQRLHLLSEAIDALPPRCREVFLMSRMDGLGNAEIAERLGISRNMVEKHIVRALVACRARLDEAAD